MEHKVYRRLADAHAPRSPLLRNCCNAFWTGGLICVLGQLLTNGYGKLGLDQEAAGTAAALAKQTGTAAGLVDPEALQSLLSANGANPRGPAEG